MHDTRTIYSETNKGLFRSVLATTIKNVPYKAFLLIKALKTRLKSTQSSEVRGWGRSMLTPECTHSPGTQGSLPTQNYKWNAVHLPSWLISRKKNWTPKWEWYTKTTFLLRWKRRLQRCFPLAGFPDPGSTSHCPQPSSSRGLRVKDGRSSIPRRSFEQVMKSYSLITNVPGARRPDAPMIRGSRLQGGPRPRPPARSRESQSQDENFASTATGAGFGNTAESLNSAGRPLLPAAPLL